MKLSNGYPVATPSGAIWIVEVAVPVKVREAAYPDAAYTVEDEDSAVEAIEAGLVLDEDWLVDHE